MTLPALSPTADEGAIVGFNYESLGSAEADAARAAAERIKSRLKAGLIEVGLELIDIKAKIGHGAFGPWMKAEFGMDERTAQNYMRTATVFGDKSEIVSVLPASTIYALAAKSTPETVRDDVVRQVAEGQRPKPAEIAETIRQAKQEERARQEAEREAERLAKMTDEERAVHEAGLKRQRKNKKRREDEAARQSAEWNTKQERERQAAQEAAEMVASRFGNDLDRFMALMKDAGIYEVQRALADLTSRSRLDIGG